MPTYSGGGGGGGGMTLTILSESSILADGTEQTLITGTGLGIYFGIISLENMVAIDVVNIRVDGKIAVGDSYISYFRQQYLGTQADPFVHISPKTLPYIRVTLEQVTGTYKNFKYGFYKEA